VVVTFDDGYADNLHHARPLLERNEVPATVFLTSGAIGSSREFWWDELERILLQPGALPERLQLEIDGAPHEWELGEEAQYTPQAAERHRRWEARARPPTARHRIYIALCDLLRRVPTGERQAVLERLLVWAGVPREGRETHRALTAEDARVLGEGGLVELGAHTVTHPALATRPLTEQRAEIGGSKRELEAILDRPIRSFAYPFGGSSTYTGETVGVVREAGFHCACTTTPQVVGRSADLYQLPRIYAYDWDGEQFARHLSRHLRARAA
jgi:peptidoglycan/xylan/chitin deacetylase (PgdA/CDA1 family)